MGDTTPQSTRSLALQGASNGRFRSLITSVERPAYILSLGLGAAFLIELFTGGPGRWGLSASALGDGHVETLISHMFSHASLLHLLLNTGALGTFSAALVPHLRKTTAGYVRYGMLFLLSGFAAAALYLALHPMGSVPMVGASGAICGFWGLASRLPATPCGPLQSLRSSKVLLTIRQFAISNAILFALLLVATAGRGGGLAWEAHLGGFLFGLLLGPYFLPPSATEAADGAA